MYLIQKLNYTEKNVGDKIEKEKIMSKLKDIYEDLKEYIEIVNSRIRELDDELGNCVEFTSQTKVKVMKETYENVQEELERILEGKGL